MFNDVDDTLREALLSDVPVDRTEIDITFERPTREWSSRLSKPTLNLFLFDIRERVEMRDDAWRVERGGGGTVRRTRGPRRVDLAYSVTAWTKEPDDEHRVLGRVLASMYRLGEAKLKPEWLKGHLANATVPVYLRAMPSDYLAKPADFWGVMDNELHASLTWVATVPLDVFEPMVGPMVASRTFGYGEVDRPEREIFIKVGGVLRGGGDPPKPVAYARLQVVGTGFSATTDDLGRFVFSRVPEGRQTWRIEPPGLEAIEKPIVVPATSYDIEM